MLLLVKAIIFFGIINVWLVRSKTKKIVSALFIFLSIWIDEVPQEIFAFILSLFMIFAILMHLKVGDKLIKSLPALFMLLCSIILLNI